eukprot:m.12088 g.12088  ORF g.12088 m.12088 type:complete len:341 (-) comp7116_c0_seq3:390-1412(-)
MTKMAHVQNTFNFFHFKTNNTKIQPPAMDHNSNSVHNQLRSHLESEEDLLDSFASDCDCESEEEENRYVYDDHTYTITILGDSGVGKSSLVYQYVYETDHFTEEHYPSIYNKYKVERVFNDVIQQVRLIEVSSEPEYEDLRRSCIKESQAFVLVYSVTDRRSFDRIMSLIEEIQLLKNKSTFPCILVGNKIDMKGKGASDAEGRALASKLKCQFFHTSAKKHNSVDMTFHMILQRLYTFNHTEFQGYLEKKGGGRSPFGRKTWKKRWFCLEGTEIKYKKNVTSKKTLGSIDLGQAVSVNKGKDDNKQFEIVMPDRTYLITAADLDTKVEWVELLSGLILN